MCRTLRLAYGELMTQPGLWDSLGVPMGPAELPPCWGCHFEAPDVGEEHYCRCLRTAGLLLREEDGEPQRSGA